MGNHSQRSSRALRLGFAASLAALALACVPGAAGAAVYWTNVASGNPGTGSIGQAEADGSGVDQGFVTGANNPFGIAIDEDYVYWANYGGGGSATIGRAARNGSEVENDFIVDVPQATDVAVSATHLYWAGQNAIGRAALDGSEAQADFISASGKVEAIAVYGEHLYWSEGEEDTGSTIGRARLNGTEVTHDLVSGLGEVRGLAVDSAHIYWTTGSDTIGRAGLDGTGVEADFIATENGPRGVAVDGGHVYWANNEGNNGTTIGRAGLDGTGVDQEFITEAVAPWGIAVDRPPPADEEPTPVTQPLTAAVPPPPALTRLLNCRAVGREARGKRRQQRTYCGAWTSSGPVAFPAGRRAGRAVLKRGKTRWAVGFGLHRGGRINLRLNELRPLQPGRYTLRLTRGRQTIVRAIVVL